MCGTDTGLCVVPGSAGAQLLGSDYSYRPSNGWLTDKRVCHTRCLCPPFSEQLKGVYVGLAVASASLPLRTLRDLDPSTFPLLKEAADTWSQLGARVGAEGLSSLFSLIAAFTADYSPLTQTVLLPGKVPPRGAGWGPLGTGKHWISEWASIDYLSYRWPEGRGGAGMVAAGAEVAMRFLLNRHLRLEVREGSSKEMA